jgi:hypothetical protein
MKFEKKKKKNIRGGRRICSRGKSKHVPERSKLATNEERTKPVYIEFSKQPRATHLFSW